MTIEFDNVSFEYQNNKNVINNLSFKIEKNCSNSRIVSFVGKSGCGKSTILKLASDLLKPTKGEITYSHSNLKLAFLSQEPVLFDHLSINDNARYLAKLSHNKATFDEKFFQMLAKSLRLEELIGDTNKQISSLSGGEKQRIALLQVTCIKPDILFLDEPCTGLDNATKNDFLMSLIKSIAQINALVFYVSHHNDEVQMISDEIYFIGNNGEVIYSGDEFAILNHVNSDVLEFFYHPYFSVISIKNENGRLLIGNKDLIGDGWERRGFTGENVEFSNTTGVEFKTLKLNHKHTILELNALSPFHVIVKGQPTGKYLNLEKSLIELK